MPRSKSYDRDTALEAVMDHFWAHGFVGTSIRDLTRVTGMVPKSLYAEFESKDGAFRLALARYAERYLESYRRVLGADPPGIARIREHFRQVSFGADFRGCFLVNSLAEIENLPDGSQEIVDAFLAEARTLFARNLRAGARDGALDEGTDIDSLANALLVFDLGLAVAGKPESLRSALGGAVETLLASLLGTPRPLSGLST